MDDLVVVEVDLVVVVEYLVLVVEDLVLIEEDLVVVVVVVVVVIMVVVEGLMLVVVEVERKSLISSVSLAICFTFSCSWASSCLMMFLMMRVLGPHWTFTSGAQKPVSVSSSSPEAHSWTV